jgi:hypothetical protein
MDVVDDRLPCASCAVRGPAQTELQNLCWPGSPVLRVVPCYGCSRYKCEVDLTIERSVHVPITGYGSKPFWAIYYVVYFIATF